MAFVILNRFLDMADALEDPGVHGLADLENADFVNTGMRCRRQHQGLKNAVCCSASSTALVHQLSICMVGLDDRMVL
jgi:hypothetical protein